MPGKPGLSIVKQCIRGGLPHGLISASSRSAPYAKHSVPGENCLAAIGNAGAIL